MLQFGDRHFGHVLEWFSFVHILLSKCSAKRVGNETRKMLLIETCLPISRSLNNSYYYQASTVFLEFLFFLADKRCINMYIPFVVVPLNYDDTSFCLCINMSVKLLLLSKQTDSFFISIINCDNKTMRIFKLVREINLINSSSSRSIVKAFNRINKLNNFRIFHFVFVLVSVSSSGTKAKRPDPEHS